MVSDTVLWHGHRWHLHSYVYGKTKAAKIAAQIKKNNSHETSHVVKLPKEIGEKSGKFAVYWRIVTPTRRR